MKNFAISSGEISRENLANPSGIFLHSDKLRKSKGVNYTDNYILSDLGNGYTQIKVKNSMIKY